MELYPAIDLRGGRAVRLRQGDYAHETVYGDDPVAIAAGFAAAGTAWVHVVDLDAARSGEQTNLAVVAAIAAAVSATGVRVQCGGGVRSEAAASRLWDHGVTRVVVGTAAVQDPALVGRLAAVNAAGVAVGLDTRGGDVAIHGWTDGTGLAVGEVLDRFAGLGIGAVVVTDIGRDGMLEGPDLGGLQDVLDRTSIDVLASGGVAAVSDLVALAGLRGAHTGRRLAGAIVGKAIYEGRLTVGEGVAACAASV